MTGGEVFERPPRLGDGDGDARSDADESGNKRQYGEPGIECHGHARLVGQHDDEMRGPSGATGGENADQTPLETQSRRHP